MRFAAKLSFERDGFIRFNINRQLHKCYQIPDDYEIVGGSVEENEEEILAEDLALLGAHEGDAQLPILDYQKFFYPMEDTQENPIHALIFDDERIEKPKLSDRQNKRRISSSSSSSDDDTNSSVVCSFKKKVKTFIDSEAEVEDEFSEDEEIEMMEREEESYSKRFFR